MRLPRTSYGYAPPPRARARGWSCPQCRSLGEEPPRRWPHPCPECGTAADPDFESPWAHDAEGHRLRHGVRFEPDPALRAHNEVRLHVWEYEDAHRRGDLDAAEAARLAFHETADDVCGRGYGWAVTMNRHVLAITAARAGDLSGLAAEILLWHPDVDTSHVEDDNDSRTAARTFVSCCTTFLLEPASLGHPSASKVDRALRDVAARASEVLTVGNTEAIRRVRQLHGGGRVVRELTGVSRSAGAVTGGLVPVLPGSRGRLPRWWRPFAAVDRSTARLVRHAEATIARARGGEAPERLTAALDDLVTACVNHRPDGPLLVQLAAAVADAAFVLGETQNDAARLMDAADRLAGSAPHHREGLPSLAHLLRAYGHLTALADGDLEQAVVELRRAENAPDELAALLRPDLAAMLAWLGACRDPEAVDKAIEQCESAGALLDGRPGAADVVLARLLLWRALLPTSSRDTQITDLRRAIGLAGRHCRAGRSGRWQAETIRTNARHALEAVSGTETLVKQAMRWQDAAEASATSSTADQARIALAWVTWAVGTDEPVAAASAYQHLMSIVPLDAAVRYDSTARDLVLAQAQEHTEEAGFWLARAGRFRDAVVALETGRAVTLGLADPGAGPTAVGRPAAAVKYEDVTSTADGEVIVYVAAARTRGYALVVAGAFDPVYLELPELDRATVEGLRERCLPPGGQLRDADIDPETVPPDQDELGGVLRTLWDKGIRELVLRHAGAPLITLIPIGQLSLLPLHAAGDPGPVTDELRGWRHAGHFSAIRYAPNARTLRRCRATAAAFDDDALTMLAAHVPQGHGIRPRLHHVELETNSVARSWPGRVRVEPGCTWERFQQLAADYEVWHLACHAAGSPFAAEQSSLAFEDADVTLAEVRSTLTRAPRRLVVLSACQTNMTGVALPNEVVGFPTTLLQLGFAGAIATAWSVDDRACTFLMTCFHHRWRGKREHPAIALSRAQQWLRSATRADLSEMVPDIAMPEGDDPYPYAHPQFWAAFAYTGA